MRFVKAKHLLITLIVLVLVLLWRLLSPNPDRLATINYNSLLSRSVQIFISQSGANLFTLINYDYTRGELVIDYMYPETSELAQAAGLHLGKRYKMSDFQEVYTGHLNYNACFFRPSLLSNPPLGLSYRVSWAFYGQDPRPLGFIAASFTGDLDESDSRQVCRTLEQIATKIR